ncbi:Fur family transcriptional regulator [Fulvivirga sediminis]|uniref:Transcriptional repressor n=1 Tax=Fulvivirga sediminis TaxID=2803949 RepID=A0A937JXH6_9BACT|nr:transcriptional repressor [Fulvivirga sediminis]MBL3654639.1 transcriptional repressor [Fulvivirga sediminis]
MDTKKILNDYKLKSTPCRSEVLQLLVNNEHALSNSDIENQIDVSHDRVTVYRTLKSFLDKGIIHKVLDDEGVTKYAVCHECSKEEHHHEHVHFKCDNCGLTQCMDNIQIPQVKLPSGFTAKEKNLLIQGICDQCNN